MLSGSSRKFLGSFGKLTAATATSILGKPLLSETNGDHSDAAAHPSVQDRDRRDPLVSNNSGLVVTVIRPEAPLLILVTRLILLYL